MFTVGQTNVTLSDGTPVTLTAYTKPIDFLDTSLNGKIVSVIPPKGVTPKGWPAYRNPDGGLLYNGETGRMLNDTGSSYPTLVTGEQVNTDNGNGALLKQHGLQVVHINHREDGERSMTIAFKGTDTLLEVATSVTHPKDTFCRKVGTKMAIDAFLAGKTVRIPMTRFWQGHKSEFIKTVFAIC